MFEEYINLKSKADKIKLVLTDNDGVLTDGGVYYSANGEELKKFNIRDGMGVARLRKSSIDVGIITGENSEPVRKRAEKLAIEELHLFIKDKKAVLDNICQRRKLSFEEIAYIGDDINDQDVFSFAGLTACPSDALYFIKKSVDYICKAKGGHGAFREFAELILYLKET